MKAEKEITFEQLLQEIRSVAGEAFPNTAVMELPHVISSEVQEQILSSDKSTEEIAHSDPVCQILLFC